MKIAIACDHGGFPLKDLVKDVISASGEEVIDLGTDSDDSVDYPDYAYKAIELFLNRGCDRIVLLCGTGIGMSICANRVEGLRGTLCHDAYTARMARLHNDSNCLVVGGRVTGPAIASEIVETWLKTGFEGGRHQARLDKIEGLKKDMPRSSKA